MKAIVVGPAHEAVLIDRPIPTIASDEILIKTEAVALNPTDWKHAAGSTEGSGLGCDFCGTVEKVGDDVKNVRVGQRVAGFVHGGIHKDGGSFAEYLKSEATLVWKVPDNISPEEAAALGGVGPHTAVQALYMRHKLQWPDNPTKEAEPVLVWAGSTSVGMYDIQLLKISGYKAITTASPKNFELLKSLGADDVYDYNDPETPAKISKAYPTLSRAVDNIAEKGTTDKIVSSFGKNAEQKTIWTLLEVPDKEYPPNVKVAAHLAYTTLGKPANFLGTMKFPAMPQDKADIEEWLELIPGLVESGKLKSNPIWSQTGGIAKIPEGLALLREGKVSARKVTFKV